MNDKVKALSRNIEAIYPLAPMQQGLLFHSLLHPGKGMYLLQYRHVMVMPDLDLNAFRQAWAQVVERHELLRTSFVWKQQKRPMQVVHKQVELPITYEDWSHLSEGEQQGRLEQLLSEERAQGLDFTKAPLMRVRLYKIAPDTYQFVRSYHHILMDAWCFSIIMMDFLNGYRAAQEGRRLNLSTPRPYRDFIRWLEAQKPEDHQEFWQQRLAGFDTPNEFGFGHVGRIQGAAEPVEDCVEYLTLEQTQSLQNTAARHGITLNTLVQGAWALLLARYSGDRDLVFGITVAGRPVHMQGMESIVGLFINSLPLRWSWCPDDALGPWLKALQTENLSLREHESVSLADIQRWSEVQRQDLFQSLFVFENAPIASDLRQSQLDYLISDMANRTHTNYPVTVVIVPGERLHLQLTYQTDWFLREEIEQMLRHFRALLLNMGEALSEKPETPLHHLAMLDEQEIALQQQVWAGGGLAADEQLLQPLYIERLQQQVRKTPERVAIVHGEQSLTFDQLNRAANRLARHLRAQGVKSDDLIAVFDERGLDLVVMIVATLKAGAGWLPLDPRNPPQRLAQVLRQSRTPLLIHSAGQGELAMEAVELLEQPLKSVLYDSSALGSYSDDDLNIPVHDSSLAYCIFTSGSTGTPKGAMVAHAGMLNNILGKLPGLGLDANDVIAQTAPQCFDISVWQTLAGMVLGARTVILGDCVVQNPDDLAAAIERHGISILEAVPSLMQSLLDAGLDRSRLRWVLATGEALPPALARRWFERYPAIPLMNAYGPAECSDDVAFHPLLERLPEQRINVPIGRATLNNRLYLLNADLQPIPAGAVGEIFVAGVGVGRGYMADPARTAAVFLPDPIANDGSRLYRTGDLARFLPNGDLEYVGRTDHQVKIRGHRIELDEIEACLTRYPGVREAVVVARDDQQRSKVLVAYVVADTQPGIEALREHVLGNLPPYMIPSAFMFLERFPLNGNGKIDRKSLPAPDFAAQSQARYVAPSSELQSQMVEAWQSVLGLDQVGVEDNFFELGGHSLLATQLIGLIGKLSGKDLPLRIVFERPTIAAMADWLENRTDTAQSAPTRLPRPEKLPLSFAQQRLWFLQQLDPQSPAYNLAGAVRLTGALNIADLQRALQSVLDQHEVLRTGFIGEAEGPSQVILARTELELPLIDVQSEEALHDLLRQDAMMPFDLQAAPLLRARLYRLAPEAFVLSLNCHHIVADGWSLQLIIDGLCKQYRHLRQGLSTEAPVMSMQYADYALWQRQWMNSKACEQELGFWREQLAGELPVLELAADFPRPAQASQNGGRVEQRLPEALTARLRAFSARHGWSNFTPMLAAFQLLLRSRSGEDDIIVGVPVANRHHAALQPLVGCFVNTLVYRKKLSGERSLLQLMTELQALSVSVQSHQDLPFDYLIEQLGVARQVSYNPLFQVMFNYFPGNALERFELTDVIAEPLDNRPDSALCDLHLDVRDSEHGISLSLQYSSDLFREQTVQTMAEQYLALLEALLDQPEKALGELVWQPAERALARLDGPEVDGRQDILQAFELQVARQPDAIAVLAGDQRLTYAELNQAAERLAAALQAHGVGIEDRVAFNLPRDARLPTAMLGILKAGAAYVPLAEDTPPERGRYILDAAQPRICLGTAASLETLAEWNSGVPLLDIDALSSTDTLRTPAWMADQLAYVLYTSGSTGKPKGVAISRGNLMNLMLAVGQVLPLTARDRVLALTTATFDIAIVELLLPLAHGASILLADREQARDPQAIDQLLEASQPTVMQATPATWRMLVAHTSRSWQGVRAISGGEALPCALAEAIEGRGARVINGYGPTEATVYSTFEVRNGNESGVEVPIGQPVANTAAYVLDADLQPVAAGVPGELYLAGANLGRGYFAAARLTAAAFLPDPFVTGARMYRTGDRVRRNSNGSLDYLGRLDFQVKLRGFRIELGEIEALLARIAGVREAAVVLLGNGEAARLVGYYAGDAQDEALLRETLAAQLPDYMLPSQFVHLETLPLSPSGKVDRKALPEPLQRDGRRSALSGEWEQELARLWEELLGSSDIGAEDNFFALGGHSLLAARLVARIAEQHGRRLPLRTLFEHPVLRDLAAQLAATSVESEGILRPFKEPLAPLHFTQQRLWFLDRLQGDTQAYHLSLALRLDAVLQLALLEQALTQLVSRQHSLRTVFSDTADGARQRVEAQAAVQVSIEPLESDEHSPAFARKLSQEAQRAFDLTSSPLFRVRVYQGQGRSVLQVTLHHIIADARSLEIFFNELQLIYQALLEGRSACLPKLPLQFSDIAASWQAPAGQALIESQLEYWRQTLAGEPPVLNLPTDLPRPAEQGYKGQRLRFDLPAALVEQLRETAQRHGLTAFAPLLAAWKTLLARHSGQREIWMGLPVAHRHQAHTDNLIGYFATTQVLRSSIDPLQSVEQFWQQLQATHLAAQQHGDVPFERLVEALQVRRDLSHTPLFQALFNLIQRDVAASVEQHFAGAAVQRLNVESDSALVDIGLHIEQHGDDWQCVLEYNTDLFLPHTAQRYADEYRYLLEGMLKQPEARLWDIDLANADHALDERPWNLPAQALQREVDLIARFERQVQLTPEALAVDCQDQQWTYAQLNARSNRLAHWLRARGVGTDDLIAVCLTRGPWLLPTLLAIHKAGAAYLPLDPQHPAERLRFIIGHARPARVLGESLSAEALKGVDKDLIDQLSLDDYSAENLALPVNPQQRAYVIYTSGSTGTPKGVQVTRDNLSNLLAGLDRQLPLGASDVWLASTTYAFDMCKPELFLPLVNGAALLLARREQVVDGHQLFALLRRATVFQATPAGWQILLETGHADWPAIRGLIGGEAVPGELVTELRSRGVTLINAYGPTETTVWSTTQALQEVPNGVADIGSPLLNTRCYVLDEMLRPVPLGTTGELYIAGSGVTRGYQHAPAITASAYLPDPYASEPGSRMYRTGDLVRRRNDGRLAYVGRSDFQVKVRGFRIEPGEIESLLRRYPGVEEAVVMIDARSQSLFAWLQTPSPVDQAALRRHLEGLLPGYMIPAGFIEQPRFALNANGKIDRKSLPVPQPVALEGVAPRNELEQQLAEIWQELLEVPQVGVFNSFFELGGHSLLAMRLMTRVENRFGIKIELRSLFHNPTIAALAEQIEKPQGPSTDEALDEMQRLLSEMEE
ncbi:non-ribosomal peptide synthetase [Pseudomonas capsici]|uniref:Non-ribosomal peptide synthetase n=1 Tax=Pseudomonas capsici TaxID=2810614 RepID=A0ABT3BY58_9PSED|nr:non-ribosomal peptide synthetase [Pseudomonas capsici]MBN6715620.1 amino acid adenylation domain-containing protein [Pseudomonas capsici]MBN6720663.1 amino acid adenylation domain-containing protein [Pseudomonas capsici]MBN6725505.1 amino acid adenylation domain-containing protein [Pseudomonas capsici]MCV4266015.1 non-ribosomal peptide synthetase [Pseudomonas capsici]MCV4277380.1 non-ribosomal peptide synthetase [Pseudomonas capsici]